MDAVLLVILLAVLLRCSFLLCIADECGSEDDGRGFPSRMGGDLLSAPRRQAVGWGAVPGLTRHGEPTRGSR